MDSISARVDGSKRDVVYDVVARNAVRARLITLAASNDDLPLTALLAMLGKLRQVTRGAMRLVVDRPLTHDALLSANDASALTAQRVAVGWAAANDVEVVSCANKPAPADVLTDPWARDPSASRSIRYWHALAHNVVDLLREERVARHVAIFDEWTASGRGVGYSLDHVTDIAFPKVSLHMGCDLPSTVDRNIQQAPFDWRLPIK